MIDSTWARYSLGKFILTTALILSSNASDGKSGVEEVEELLSLGDGIDFHGASEYIVLMGSSGVGKSTLAKFLIKDPTLRVARKGQRNFLYADNDKTISTVTRKSKTLLPNYYKDNETGQVIVDLPGFSDTREPKYEIAAAYFIKSVLESTKNLKLVLVENAFSLTEGQDRYGLTRLVRHVADLIPDLTEFSGSVGVVATKASFNGMSDEDNIEEILDYLKSFSADVALDEENWQAIVDKPETRDLSGLKVLETMIGMGDGKNIGLFYRPNKEGSPWESYLVNKCWDSLRKLIFEVLPYHTVSKDVKFKYSLSVEGQVFVKENLINTTNDRVYTEMQNILRAYVDILKEELAAKNKPIVLKTSIAKTNNEELQVFASNLKDLGKIVEDLRKLQLLKGHNFNNLTYLVRKAEFFHGVIEKDTSSVVAEIRTILKSFQKISNDAAIFYNFLNELTIELDTYWPQFNRKELSSPLTQTNFRKIILSSEKYNLKISDKDALYAVAPQVGMIEDLNRILEQYLDYTVSFKHNQSELSIEGQNILISEIKGKLPANSTSHVQNIYIYAQKKIFIDESFTVEKANLFFVAPAIEGVVKEPGFIPKIQTIGSDSKELILPASKCTAFGMEGQRGEPGRIGGKAGNILFAALEVTSLLNVKIESKGGRGGKGQDGGEGCDGRTSPTPTYTNVPGRFDKVEDVLRHFQSQGYSAWWSDGAVQVSNSRQNRNPTRGGSGGEGGPGGNPGTVIIRTKKPTDGLISETLSFGESGAGGEGGAGGRGMASCAQAHLYCEMHQEKRKTSKFSWNRFNCQWFEKGCDIIVHYTCKFVTAKFCPDMTPDAKLGGKGGWSSLAQSRPLPPQEIVDTSQVKAEVARLSREIGSPKIAELDSFIHEML